MHRLTACAAAALVLTLSACGTTVPLTQGAARGQDGATLGLGEVPAATGEVAVDGSVPSYGPGLPGPSTTLGTASGDQVTSGSAAGRTAGGSAPSGGTSTSTTRARGVTDKTITIGIAIASGTDAVADAFGVSGASSVSEQEVWDTLVKDLNSKGGLLGRRVVLYTHPVDLASFVANPAQTYAEICSDFRDDHPVFTVFITISDPSVQRCLAKMGTPLVVYGANVGSILPKKDFDEYGGSYLYVPGGVTQERVAELLVESLVERKFFSPWDTVKGAPGVAPLKIGLIHADTPEQNAYYAAHARELKKYGLTFSDTVTYAGDAGTALSVTQGAVLKFASEGITHVFGASAFFLRYAESQRYRPRYAFIPALGAFGAANSPPEQLSGAMTIGWAPTADVLDDQDPGPTAGAAGCLAVMRKAGIATSDRQDRKVMFGICDAVYSFRDALTGGRAATVPGLRTGYESLGQRFPAALTFEAAFGPGRHHGVDSVRDMAFDTACSCLVYTSRANRS